MHHYLYVITFSNREPLPMLCFYLLLSLLTITELYSADSQKQEHLSLDEIAKQVAILVSQTEENGQRIMGIETQIKELHRYDKKLNRRIKKIHKILHEKQLEHEKSLKDLRGYNDNLVELIDDHHKKIEQLTLGRSSSCPELIPVEHRLDIQEKEIQGLHKCFLAHEAEYRLIKEDLQRLGIKQRKSEERDESTRREIDQLKRANAKNQYH